MKKILLIATGGTIASRKTEEGLAPSITPQELLAHVPDAAGPVPDPHAPAPEPGLHQHPAGALAGAGQAHRRPLQRLRRLRPLPRHGHPGLHRLGPVLSHPAHQKAHRPHRGPALHRRGHHRRQGKPPGRPAVRLRRGQRGVHRLRQPCHRRHQGQKVPDKKATTPSPA